MVGVEAFTPLCNSHNVSICFHSFSSASLSQSSYKPNGCFLSNRKCFKERIGFRAFAVKKRGKDKGGVLERESFEEFKDEEDDDDEEGFLLPMEKMKQWLENRPPGFGQGKAYDTSVEDKLLDEIQQSRVAQLANINKLKHNPVPTGEGGAGQMTSKVPEVVTPAGVRVRLLNLPKKKNIHRDLQLAFKGVPGLISISPAVAGTKKTRDPICKGYGYVYFKTQEQANRFIQNFGTTNIAFGKIQKQIKCELASPSSKDDARGIPLSNTMAKSSLPVLSYHEDDAIITKISSMSSNSLKESESYESDDSDEYEDASDDSDTEILETASVDTKLKISSMSMSSNMLKETEDLEEYEDSDASDDSDAEILETASVNTRFKISSMSSNTIKETDDLDEYKDSDASGDSDAEILDRPETASDKTKLESTSPPHESVLSKQETRPPVKKKPVAVKTKGPKPVKLGSAYKLKSKDKSLLTGVLSKYGANAKPTMKKDS